MAGCGASLSNAKRAEPVLMRVIYSSSEVIRVHECLNRAELVSISALIIS